MEAEKETQILEEIKGGIRPLDARSMEEAQRRWKEIAKPLESLGKLEDAVVRMAGIKENYSYELKKKGLLIFCADNGVVAEGVTQTGQEVTAVVAENLTKKAACTSIMAEVAGVDVFVADIGMAADVLQITRPEEKVARGTKNLAVEPAMTRREVLRAILAGIKRVEELKNAGYDILASGEMGIGNTTTSSAVTAVLLNVPVKEVTGKGAGLSGEGLLKKIQVIEKAVRLHRPHREDVIDVLAKVGGLDIAGLTGVCIGGAVYRIPVVLDGMISLTAALCAVRMVPLVREYLFASHLSKEPAAGKLLLELGLSALLHCNFSLGEGSGAVAVMPLLEMGLQVYRRMPTFEEIQIRQYEVLK